MVDCTEQRKLHVMQERPIGVNPDNPRYFTFRGRTRVLICATEHYGSVLNRAFDFERYLDDAADKQQTLTRVFLLFRELQSARNPYSPCKPDSPDYLAPWVRSGPGVALDGEPMYDLDVWNDAYFARLHRFLSMASERAIVVEVTLFSNTYVDEVWALNPLRASNNRNGVGNVEWPDYTSQRDPALVARQTDFVRHVVRELNGFDNIYYEICNEPGGGFGEHVTPRDVDHWQEMIASVVREEEAGLPNPHLVFWSQAFTYHPRWEQEFDESFANPHFDAVNVHPLPDLIFHGRRYDLGRFMGKELKLAQIRDFCLAVQPVARPCVLDEDNSASLYRDQDGWTIHRKRAWMALLCGCHYDYIDFSITVGREAGTPASQRAIRTWMRHLSNFIHAFDVAHAVPSLTWIQVDIPHAVVAGLCVSGQMYVAYIADGRELGESGAGQPCSGTVRLDLPSGIHLVSFYAPVTGLYSPAIALEGARQTTLYVPPFEHDIVLVVARSTER